MSTIEGIGPTGIARLPPRNRVAGANRFSVEASPDPGAAQAVEAAPAMAIGMLALQEIGAESVQDRAARRHGRAMLAVLAILQQRVLGGAAGAGAERELADLAAGVPVASDPALAAALQAITLRARVELARRGL